MSMSTSTAGAMSSQAVTPTQRAAGMSLAAHTGRSVRVGGALLVMLAQAAPLFLEDLRPAGADPVSLRPMLVFSITAMVLPLLLVLHTIARRQQWKPRRLVSTGVLISILFGVAVSLTVQPDQSFSWASRVLLGCIAGSIQVALWLTLAVLPDLLGSEERRQIEMVALQQRTQRLEAEAKLLRLRRQLEPHFLLNTLNTIGGLVATRPETARALVIALGDLLRDALTENAPYRMLVDEIQWLRRYTEILEIRHGQRLRFEWDIDGSAHGAMVPHLLLQPLIENAVQHGALHRKNGVVRIGVSRIDSDDRSGWLRYIVWDNGLGATAFSRSGGIGLEAVSERVQLAHPASKFQIHSDAHGTRVTIELPGHEQELHS